MLAATVAWRLDGAVRTAYTSGWVAPKFAPLQNSDTAECHNCLRLPTAAWSLLDALAGVLALVLLLLAAFLFHLRQRPPELSEAEQEEARADPGHARGAEAVAERQHVHRVVLALSAVVLAIAAVAFVVRLLGANGHGTGWVTGGSWAIVVGILLILLIVVMSAVSAPDAAPHTFVRRILRFVQRQPVNLLALLLLTAVVMFVGQTSGQAIDSIRTWAFGDPASVAIARLGFGVASVLLLSLVIYEGGVQLTQVASREPDQKDPPFWVWFIPGVPLIALGVLLLWIGPFGWGLVVVGVILVLVGLLDIPDFGRRSTPARPDAAELAIQRRYDERLTEIVAIVPLLLFAATSLSAALDAALSRGKGNAAGPLLPAAILALLAVAMTSERMPSRFDIPSWKKSLALFVVAAVAGGLLSRLGFGPLVAAVVSLVLCAIGIAYVAVVFWIRPPRKWEEHLCCSALSLPTALAVGVGAFVAVHLNPLGSAKTVGTLAVVCIAAAFWIGALNLFVFGSHHLRAPGALEWIGLARLPVLTLIAIAWIGAGVFRTPPTIHQTRLVERQRVAAAIPPTPTLNRVFNKWVAAQPDLNDGSAGKPVPMLLVAAHGGGIRAAYWTALALDCIVGVSALGYDRQAVLRGDDTARTDTCKSKRRPPAQQRAAARRIFLLSGVSGGAVGLFAYARELLARGSLTPETWVDDRLARDFAAPTIGWGLFHDAVAHWFGLNAHRDGTCQMHLPGTSRCLTEDRADLLERSFDDGWTKNDAGPFSPFLRLTWDMRSSPVAKQRSRAELVPFLVMNTTVTGGKARGVVSAANLGAWPQPESDVPVRGSFDRFPLAGTVEISQAICFSRDLRLSTAALLAGRFPYVSSAGHISGRCRSDGVPQGIDARSDCAKVKAAVCDMRLVDGGYAENSGLFTIDTLWPSILDLVVNYNRKHSRRIAPVIVELDNHYQASFGAEPPVGGTSAETLVPPLTAFGARNSMETYARALAVRLRPPGCMITISPGLHPGLLAPLGWELSEGARDDLKDGLTRPHPTARLRFKYTPVLQLRRLQQWVGGGRNPRPQIPLTSCIPKTT